MGFEGWRMRVRLDEDTLKAIANTTYGQYLTAGNAAELNQIYRSLNSRFVMEKKETEITALVSAVAALSRPLPRFCRSSGSIASSSDHAETLPRVCARRPRHRPAFSDARSILP